MQINTVNEQDAYDKGFADGKDYWVPEEQERALQAIEPWLAKQLNDGKLTRNDILDFIELFKGEGK